MTLVTHPPLLFCTRFSVTSSLQGVIDVPKDKEFPEKVDECLKAYVLSIVFPPVPHHFLG